MYQTNIEQLAAQTIEAFSRCGYTSRSLGEKKFALQKIVRLHRDRGCNEYNPNVMALFVEETECRYARSEIARTRCKFLTKAADYLTEFHDTGTVSLSRRISAQNITPFYESVLKGLMAYEVWEIKLRRSTRQFAMPYFKWLQSKGNSDFSHVTEVTVREYLIDCSKRMNGNSMDTTRRALKKLYAYLFETGVADSAYADVLTFSVPLERKIKKPVPQAEIAAVLNAIDRSKPAGKRDYAMFLLAIVTGLRSVDIANLKMEDIDWRNGEIRLVQSKTGKALALPLTADVGKAIQNYILNGRQPSELSYVFLRAKSPALQLGRTLPYQQFNVYRQRVGLPKCSFHGLRRALGTNMVISGVPVTTVAQVLGHSGISATKQYISLDSSHLKECALALSGFEPFKKGVI